MSPRYILKTFAVLVTFICLAPAAANATISRNLKLGDSGPDVRELQQLLNRDPDTRVAMSGPGSSGNETEYFGVLTQSAVKKIQQKYASEILTPIGLTSPTGYVGTQTRAFLARISSALPVPPPTGSGQPTIGSASPSIITKVPQEITITGSGFLAQGNTVLTSTEPKNAFTSIPSTDGKTLRFTYTFRAAEMLKEKAANLGTSTPQEILKVISQSILDPVTGQKTTRIPLVIGIKNANGESGVLHLLIDMPAVLLGN